MKHRVGDPVCYNVALRRISVASENQSLIWSSSLILKFGQDNWNPHHLWRRKKNSNPQRCVLVVIVRKCDSCAIMLRLTSTRKDFNLGKGSSTFLQIIKKGVRSSSCNSWNISHSLHRFPVCCGAILLSHSSQHTRSNAKQSHDSFKARVTVREVCDLTARVLIAWVKQHVCVVSDSCTDWTRRREQRREHLHGLTQFHQCWAAGQASRLFFIPHSVFHPPGAVPHGSLSSFIILTDHSFFHLCFHFI